MTFFRWACPALGALFILHAYTISDTAPTRNLVSIVCGAIAIALLALVLPRRRSAPPPKPQLRFKRRKGQPRADRPLFGTSQFYDQLDRDRLSETRGLFYSLLITAGIVLVVGIGLWGLYHLALFGFFH